MHSHLLPGLEKAYGFDLQGKNYGNGHINDTFITETTPRYIVQRINQNVFKNPDGVMQNFDSVTAFLRNKIGEMGGDPERETLTLLYTKEGKTHTVIDGEYYRAYRLVDNSYTVELPEDAEQFKEAARAFGRFQKLLSDFPAEKLVETIPHFHDTPDRYRQLEEAVKNDRMGRKKDVLPEIAFVEERKGELSRITDLLASGEIPMRVTHNDTKINNVLFDQTAKTGLCVIDLDTVMPGSLLYDFGDAIRAGATTGEEDEKDLTKVNFSLEYYKAFREGFLEEMGNSITEKEKELLPLSAELMTLECGMRFLADYLNGDVYFKITRPEHNLDRARTQFKLVSDMEKTEKEMQ